MNWDAGDIEIFLAACGTAVTIDDGSVTGKSITGIFENVFVEVNGVEMSSPSLQVATSDIENFTEHQTRLYVNNTDYLVTGIQDNGDGWTRLILREA